MTTFVGLWQVDTADPEHPIIVHVEVRGIWYAQDKIETRLSFDDKEAFTKMLTDADFHELLANYGLKELRQKLHTKGWYYYLGDDNLKVIKYLNTPENVADHLRWNKGLLA